MVCGAALISLASCHRQELEDPARYLAHLPITIDWSESLISEDYILNTSIYCFAEGSSKPYIYVSGDINFATVQLPVGVYSILIINDTVDDVKGVEFKDDNIYNDFSANIVIDNDAEQTFYKKEADVEMIASQGRVAAWRYEGFEVTAEMIEYTRTEEFEKYLKESKSKSKSRGESGSTSGSFDAEFIEILSSVKPQPVTSRCNITLQVENLNNAMYIEGVLTGTADGAILSTNERIPSSTHTNAYRFYFEDRTYDDTSDPVDGIATHELNTFGKQPNGEYELQLNVILSTGELVTIVRDVTTMVNSSEGLDIDICLDNETEGLDDSEIVLPEGTASGFGVGDWGEGENVELL